MVTLLIRCPTKSFKAEADALREACVPDPGRRRGGGEGWLTMPFTSVCKSWFEYKLLWTELHVVFAKYLQDENRHFFFPSWTSLPPVGNLNILIMKRQKWMISIFTNFHSPFPFLLYHLPLAMQCYELRNGSIDDSPLFIDGLWPCVPSNLPEDLSGRRFSVKIPPTPVYGRALAPAM